jgi:hypothetical protein
MNKMKKFVDVFVQGMGTRPIAQTGTVARRIVYKRNADQKLANATSYTKTKKSIEFINRLSFLTNHFYETKSTLLLIKLVKSAPVNKFCESNAKSYACLAS